MHAYSGVYIFAEYSPRREKGDEKSTICEKKILKMACGEKLKMKKEKKVKRENKQEKNKTKNPMIKMQNIYPC